MPDSARQADSTPFAPETWRREPAQCARQFSHGPAEQERLPGLIPTKTRARQRLLRQARPWIEPAQSYEKSQPGLGAVFLNSLRLTWRRSLPADAAVLPRARVILETPGPDLIRLCEAQPDAVACAPAGLIEEIDQLRSERKP